MWRKGLRVEQITSTLVLPSQLPGAGSSRCWLVSVGRRLWRTAALCMAPLARQPIKPSQAVDLTVSTVCLRFDFILRQRSTATSLSCPAWSTASLWEKGLVQVAVYHRGRPHMLSCREPCWRPGAGTPSCLKTSCIELSLSQCQNVATRGLHGDIRE